MGLSEDGEETVLQQFEEICLDLNMDIATKDEALQNYRKISSSYSLEGDQIHWLACALYEACRGTNVPTVGRGTVEGNCVSLTRLLRSSKFSLVQFFNKMRKWSDMANLSKEFRDKIDKLERNFAVSTVIFKKFEPIFLDIFVNPLHELPRQPRGRKQRRHPCTSNEVFHFAWTMFVLVKGNFPAISDDLVNSYHLLLCCIDWIYANAVLGGRKDLLNVDFEGLPEGFHTATWKPDTEAPCIMQLLCEKHDGLVVEAKTIKEHWWKPHIKRLFEKKVLKGKIDSLSAILELGSFEDNNKTINNLYEEFVLGVGDFDERIFLGEDSGEEIGTGGDQNTSSDLSEQMQVKRSSLKQHFDETKSLTPSTPLTGRRYLKEKDPSNVTPVSTATQSVSRLQVLLSGAKFPSDTLVEVFKSCSKNPHDEIVARVKEMGETFCTHYTRSDGSQPGAPIDFARKRLQLGESLYYKTLEAIVLGERKRIAGGEEKEKKVNLLALLENDSFHRSLFACCVEIVIFSYNSQRTFPWIVDIFELSSYHFYKVIEIIIRAEKGLSRDVIKHLNHIEESILECHAWKHNSPLWEAIKEDCVPNCEEVMPSSHIEMFSKLAGPGGKGQSGKHPRLRSLVGDIKATITKTGSQDPSFSPVSPMAVDRFSSPNPGNAKRRLFGVGPSVTTLPFSSVPTSNSNSPVITVISSGSLSQPPGSQAKSILASQLKGGISDALVVSNRMASTLAPSPLASLPITSSSQPSIPSSTVAASASSQGNKTSVSAVSDKSGSDSNTDVASTSSGQSGATTPSKSSSSSSQQAIVAMMEDGRQILIPVQIAQPTAGSSAPVQAGLEAKTLISPASTTTVKVKKNNTTYYQVNLKLDPKPEMKGEKRADHNYNKPQKTGSLALFFRKVYHLASVRLRDLFEKLDIDDDELLKKIWTCFEHSMVNYIHLMCERHLDQIIMCSIYLIAKVTERPLTFQSIMKCYRLQPQAESHVYRSVLLSGRHRHGSGSSDGSKSNSGTSSPISVDGKAEANKDKDPKTIVRSSSTLPHPHPGSHPPTPTQLVGESADCEVEEERGDLINFYNLVFLKKVRTFALRFSEKVGEVANTPKLSPLPAVRNLLASPHRVSKNHSLFISPHQSNSNLPTPRSLSFCINHSPSKELQAINKMIRANKSLTKRALDIDGEDPGHSPAKQMATSHPFIRRLQDIRAMDSP